MSNHVHIIQRTRSDWTAEWSVQKTARRWLSIFPKRRDFDHSPKRPTKQEIKVLAGYLERMAEIRGRLSSVSWFMRCFSEFIARWANKEDHCKGRFWEGRFKCQALLDEAACLAAMAYVDLNPVRAGIPQTPEESEFTSIYDRIVSRTARRKLSDEVTENPFDSDGSPPKVMEAEETPIEPDQWLCPIDNETPMGPRGILSLSTDQYIDLVDWTGRQVREDKSGAIPNHLASILYRLEIDAARWVHTVQNFGRVSQRMVGKVESMTSTAKEAGKRWWQGINACRKAFSPA